MQSRWRKPQSPRAKAEVGSGIDDRRDLTERILSNVNVRNNCDPHGNVLYDSPLSSNSNEGVDPDSLSQYENAWLSPDGKLVTQGAEPVANAAQSACAINSYIEPLVDDWYAWSAPQGAEAVHYQTDQAKEVFCEDVASVHYQNQANPVIQDADSECAEVDGSRSFGASPDNPKIWNPGEMLFGIPKAEPTDIEARTNKRTVCMSLPHTGVVRSNRGTIEMVVHANGRKITPTYNSCGMLVHIDVSDGYTFAPLGDGTWKMLDNQGHLIAITPITSLTFDKRGNLRYLTADGCKTTLYTDGSVKIV